MQKSLTEKDKSILKHNREKKNYESSLYHLC